MKPPDHVRWSFLLFLIAVGLTIGQTLRARAASASGPECDEGEFAEFIELRRTEGNGPIEAQKIWHKNAVLVPGPTLHTYPDNSTDTQRISMNLEPGTIP